MAATSVQFAVATHILTALAFHYGEEVKSSTLAESVNAEPTFVRRSISKLAKAGLVATSRGKNGSCSLARAPSEITLRDIYLASEAPGAVAIHKYKAKKGCPVSANIKGCMSEIQDEIQRSIEATLGRTTLADVVGGIRGKEKRADTSA